MIPKAVGAFSCDKKSESQDVQMTQEMFIDYINETIKGPVL